MHTFVDPLVRAEGGLAIMPMNTRHAVPELRYQLDDAQARILIASGDVGGLAGCVERVIDIETEWPELVRRAEPARLGVDVGSGSRQGPQARAPRLLLAG